MVSKKQFRGYAEESERIYKILGINDIDALNAEINKNHLKPYEDKEPNIGKPIILPIAINKVFLL